MTRRRVSTAAIGMAAALALVLSACGQDNTPTEYNTLTEQNFLETCTNRYFDNVDDTLTMTDAVVDSDVSAAPDESTCRCMYDVFQTQMSIEDFTELNKDLKDNAQEAWDAVPSEIKDEVNACGTSEASTTTSTTAPAEGATTTAPAESTTTTA